MMELVLLAVLFVLPNEWRWAIIKRITQPMVKLREWAWGNYIHEQRVRAHLKAKYGIEVM